ncbi:MAG: YdeI/OmpD-associated family protein [Gordonia sp. (in: high G+C Gram-positive bacteria)]
MRHTFRTQIELGGKTATGFRVPAPAVEAIGDGKRPKVLVTINDHTYRSTVAVYSGEYMLPLNAGNRHAAGVEAGETVEVTIEHDSAERTVDIPAELAAAFAAHPHARAAFDALSYSKQRERAQSVASAKRPETRERRVAAIIDELTGAR